MSTLESWGQAMYTDISAQLKRLGVKAEKFNGPLIRSETFIGKWMLQQIEIKFIQMETMGKVRDTATVVVQAGTSETETWKLLWRTENAYSNRPPAYHSISNFPGPQLVTDGVKRWVQTTTLI